MDWRQRLASDSQYRIVIKAVCSLILNLLFAFYNGILGLLSGSLIFWASAVYYLLLTLMRFYAVTQVKKARHRQFSVMTGSMLIALSILFHIMVLISIRHRTAAVYGTIPMIAIATFTFTKITTAAMTAVKNRKNPSRLGKAVNAIRYSEVAVSLLTMQQSMLVSFGEGEDPSAVILNAFTGALVCFFILALGIITLKNSHKSNGVMSR